MPSVIRPDAFNPTLIGSPAVPVTLEQMEYVRQVLDVACSDSRFADKAFFAIVKILKGNEVEPPALTSLSPAEVQIGAEPFDIHVMGSGFTPTSTILFNGFVEPTTFVSEGELMTGVDMTVWLTPAVVPVAVVNGDIQSDPLYFEFLPSAEMTRELEERSKDFVASKKREDDERARVDRTIIDVGLGKDRVEKR